MISDRDIYATANIFIKRYGEEVCDPGRHAR
jgi:hypothetical protein